MMTQNVDMENDAMEDEESKKIHLSKIVREMTWS